MIPGPTRRSLIVAAALFGVACTETPSGLRGGPLATLDVVDGDLQSGTVGSELSTALTVRALDAHGGVIAGQVLNFVVTAGGGSVFAGAAQTNADGIARERWTLGTVAADTQRIEVRAVDAETGARIVFARFAAIGLPDAVATVTSSADSVRFTSTSDTATLVASVRDKYGNNAAVEATWTSSDTGVARVSASGLLTARASGTSLVVVSAGGRTDTTIARVVPEPASIALSPRSLTFHYKTASAPLTVSVVDRAGVPVPGATVEWRGSAIATAVNGTVVAQQEGTRYVSATSGTAVDSIPVTVDLIPASVTVSPSDEDILLGDWQAFQAAAFDSAGYQIPNATLLFAWTSSNPAILHMQGTPSNVAVSSGAAGTVTVSAGYRGVSGNATVHVTPLVLADIAVGDGYSCGLTAGGKAYCWGSAFAQGNGIQASDRPHPVQTQSRFKTIAAARGPSVCALDLSGKLTCWGPQPTGGIAATPIAMFPSMTFASLGLGDSEPNDGVFCARTLAGAAFCWGTSRWGALGNGSGGPGAIASTPVAVSGGHAFTTISSSSSGTCGIRSDGKVLCWGFADRFAMGRLAADAYHWQCDTDPVGAETTCSQVPWERDLPTNLLQIALGDQHSCALDTAGSIQCWGSNELGQLGVSSVSSRGQPSTCILGFQLPCTPYAGPIASALTFTRVMSGAQNSCGISSGGELYCWGANDFGQLANGSVGGSSSTPTRVSSTLTFTKAAITRTHGCGIATDGFTYCWGANNSGQLGAGAVGTQTAPIRVEKQ